MQGRLLPPEGGRIQCFPAARWREEFPLAATCGLDRIEWIVDHPDWEANPLMTVPGREEITALSEKTGVRVRSACADLFMPTPLHSVDAAERARREEWLARIIGAAGTLGLEHVDVPFVDASAIDGARAFDDVVGVFRRAGPRADDAGLALCLETSLPPARFRDLLEAVGHPRVRANHDIGNSASLGWPAAEEFAAIGRWVSCVHIKDRVRGGTTVPLGQGAADFPAAFAALQTCAYPGHFVMQIARGAAGDEAAWTKANALAARKMISTLAGEEASRGPRP